MKKRNAAYAAEKEENASPATAHNMTYAAEAK